MHMGITASDCSGRERHEVQVEHRILRNGEGNERGDTGQWSPGDTTGEGWMAHSHNSHKSAGDLGSRKQDPFQAPRIHEQWRPDSQRASHTAATVQVNCPGKITDAGPERVSAPGPRPLPYISDHDDSNQLSPICISDLSVSCQGMICPSHSGHSTLCSLSLSWN